MNIRKKIELVAVGAAMLCAAGNCVALTLGAAQGGVFLGQTLQLAVAIQAGSERDSDGLCLGADVFYGDTQINPDLVAVTSDVASPLQFSHVYIKVNAAVNEPVVTVHLRAGCENKTSRRYVLLPDVAPRQPMPSPVSGESQLVHVAPATAPTPTPALRNVSGTAAAVDPVAFTPGAVARKVPRVAKPESSRGFQAEAYAKWLSKRKYRLDLEALDLTVEREPVLKFSNELPPMAEEDLEKRAKSAELWRFLNATPHFKTQAMEANVKELELLTSKNHQSLQDLTQRLAKAESQRYFNPLFYGLVAVILILCAALLLMLQRLKSRSLANSPWWRGNVKPQAFERSENIVDQVPVENAPVTAAPAPATPTKPPENTGSANTKSALEPVDIDLFLDESQDTQDDRTVVAAIHAEAHPRQGEHLDFSHSITSSMRSLSTEDMDDVRQQAEFFMSLGQHEDAIRLLKDSIESSHDANPLVYLDLLRIFHALGRKPEYDFYRTDFNTIFSGRVPAYAGFRHGGHGLEAYPEVCQQLTLLWPSEKVIHYIEQCLLRSSDIKPDQTFDLQSFQDLLMLHAIAKEIV